MSNAFFRTLALLGLASLCIVACDRPPETRTPPEHVYVLKGVIEKLPDSGSPREISIHHEAIDRFYQADGSAAEMHAMTMPFPLAPKLSLEGFSVGDEVEFTYEMRWKSSPREEITEMKKLPKDSVRFGR